jgi:LPXTG-site transpeptidase (sortase) family protein
MLHSLAQKAHAVFDLIIAKRYVFAVIFFSVSFSTFTFLYATGLIPAEFKVAQTDASVQAADPEDQALLDQAPASLGRVDAEAPADARGDLPTRIVIDKIGVNSIITNPATTDENVLDSDLAKGAVRYPTSGTLGEGNLFLFGHSTNHPVVNNQAYKTFNNLNELNPGDQIVVESATHIYVYKVFSVRLTTADEALVQLQSDRNMLTISTCNTFGAKQERYVVEADFVRAETK